METRTYTIKLGVNVEVRPYVGINGAKWPSIEEVSALALPIWDAYKALYANQIEAVRQAKVILRDAGMPEAAEAISFPGWQEPRIIVEPTPATGNYTIDPFVGWRVKP